MVKDGECLDLENSKFNNSANFQHNINIQFNNYCQKMFSRTLLLMSSASHANINSKTSANQSTTNITFIATSIPTREQLLKRTESLKNKVAKLESEIILSKSVNKLLSQEVDDLHQYKRRACFILVGITLPPPPRPPPTQINMKLMKK